MPQILQNRCCAIWVLKRYSLSLSLPRRSLKSGFGIIRWRNPHIKQIEQLQRIASRMAEALISKQTALQWQLPECIVRLLVCVVIEFECVSQGADSVAAVLLRREPLIASEPATQIINAPTRKWDVSVSPQIK